MTAEKSFLLTLRIVFLLFSLQFLKDAFYKWDGYSYYMRFVDFLPDLSLVYILWTVIIAILACVLWLIVYAFFKLIPKSIIPARLEYFLFFLFFIVLPFFMKRTFYSKFSISELVGLSRSMILAIGAVSFVVFIFFGRKHLGKIVDRVLYGLDSRITPLIWLFVFLFVLAVPLSFFKKGPSETEYLKRSSISSYTQTDQNSLKRPNIILVIMDSLTSLDMPLYGYDRNTTPFISEWAKEAIVHKKVYASSSWTTPATMSIMTGQRVWTHGVWNDVFYRPVNYYENSLPKVLQDNGYDIYGFVQNRYAHPYTLGMQDAFSKKDKYYNYWIPDNFWFNKFKDIFLDRPIARVWIARSFFSGAIDNFNPPFYLSKAPPEKVFNSFLDYLAQQKQKNIQGPFFAQLHTWAPHFLYLPPKPYSGFFGDDDEFNSNQKQWSNFNFNQEYKPDEQRDIDVLRKRYDELILYSDKQFELFLENLSGLIDMSDTMVIFTSDHGESFTHGFLGHAGPHLFAPLVDVPLIIKMPGQSEGRVIDMPAGHIDIAPTILELAGLPVPDWMEGRSLSPLYEGKTLEPRPVYSVQFRENRSLGHQLTTGTIAVWEGNYKLIHYLKENRSLLFNLSLDPGEIKDIADQRPELTDHLIRSIRDHLDRANLRIAKGSGKANL